GWPGGDPANGLLNAGGDLRSRGKSRFLRHLSKVEQRQGAAGNLLAAAIGVAVERADESRQIEAPGVGDRERQVRGARQKPGEEAVVDREALAGVQVNSALLRDRRGRGPHGKRKLLGKLQPLLVGEAYLELPDTHLLIDEWKLDGGLAIDRKLHLRLRGFAGIQVAARLEENRIEAFGPLQVVEIEPEARAVARCQDPRKRGGDHHRIADGEIGGAMAHGTARPGNRHQAQRAVELREVQLDPGGAIGRYLEGPGEEGDRFLGRGTADEPAARGAATAPETACFPQRALYEAAVEVAHFH